MVPRICTDDPDAPPTATLNAVPATINSGGASVLTWTSTNAASATLDQGIGSVATAGTRTVRPSNTTTYTITVRNQAGATATASATVVVVPPCCNGQPLPKPSKPSVLTVPTATAYNDPIFDWNSNDTAQTCDPDGYLLSIQGATTRNISVPGATTIPTTDLNDGRHTVAVRAYKNCPGETEPWYGPWSDERSFIIGYDENCDTRCADEPTNVDGDEGTVKSTWLFRWNAPAQREGKKTPTAYRYRITNENRVQIAEGIVTTTSATVTGLTTPGAHTIEVFSRAVDTGNQFRSDPSDEDGICESCPASFEFNVRAINCCQPENQTFSDTDTVFRPLPLAPNVAPVASVVFKWDAPASGSGCDSVTGYEWTWDGTWQQDRIDSSERATGHL